MDFKDKAIQGYLLEEKSPVFEIVKREAIEQAMGQGGYANSMSKFLFNFINTKIFLERYW